jgi:sugar-specific transcriptional regulator TrmB
MGLTVQSDIPIIYKKIEELEKKLLEKIEDLSIAISELEDLAFEANILLEEDESWEIVRKKRDFLLKSTDWTLTPGSTVDQGVWASYRQVLRDLPQTYAKSGVKSIVWPKRPSTKGPNTGKKKGPLQ